MKKLITVFMLLIVLIILVIGASVVYMGRNSYELSNTVVMTPPYAIDPDVMPDLLIADMHADTFNFETDFFTRSRVGQVDLPRIGDAEISLMTFAIATEVPFSIMRKPPGGNPRGGNLVTLGAFSELEPIANWFSQYERGLYAINYAHDLIAQKPERMKLVENRADLQQVLDSNREKPGSMLGIVLSVEGSHILEGDPDRLDTLYAKGVRMLSLTHAFDNEAGGSSEGVEKRGITPYGEALLQKMQQLGIIIDIAHASPALADDLLDRARSPVVYSHGGVRGMCDIDRNISDHTLERVKENGGLVGIGFWPLVLCDQSDVGAIVDTIRYVADKIGVDHVALGSDFDGGVRTVFDVSGVPLLTQALLADGFSEMDVRKIMGENYINLLRGSLPGGSSR